MAAADKRGLRFANDTRAAGSFPAHPQPRQHHLTIRSTSDCFAACGRGRLYRELQGDDRSALQVSPCPFPPCGLRRNTQFRLTPLWAAPRLALMSGTIQLIEWCLANQ
ncbi:hypothetical protein LY78DRAFT_650920 [Colletotrichum sublineola]|nr:hypothetical protein LY78DRAFT_650920 [Colletotrichum sublineola]